jgi:hypothetical protein
MESVSASRINLSHNVKIRLFGVLPFMRDFSKFLKTS